MFSWGGKKEPIVYLPKEDNQACEVLEKVVLEEAQRLNIDITALDAHFDLIGRRKNLTYLRFVHARQYRLEDCKNMILNTIKWRLSVKPASVGVEEILEIAKKDYCFFHEFDIEGNPIVWINVHYHVDFSDKQEMYKKFVLFMMEEGTRRASKILDKLEKEDPNCELPRLRASLVFDMSGFGMANMDFPMVKYLAETLQTHYPDVLAHTYVVDSPWFFSKCWSMIKGWLDPVVVSKIEFVDRTQLLKNIDPDKVPIMNGGTAVHEKVWERLEKPEENVTEKPEGILTEKLDQNLTEKTEEYVEKRDENEKEEKKEKLEIKD